MSIELTPTALVVFQMNRPSNVPWRRGYYTKVYLRFQDLDRRLHELSRRLEKARLKAPPITAPKSFASRFWLAFGPPPLRFPSRIDRLLEMVRSQTMDALRSGDLENLKLKVSWHTPDEFHEVTPAELPGLKNNLRDCTVQYCNVRSTA